MRLKQAEGRRVVVWGAGAEGAAAVRALRRYAPSATVSVIAEGEAPATVEDVQVVTGDAASRLLDSAEIVIRSPGVSRYLPQVLELQERGVVITTGTALWFSQTRGLHAIGITGTKGKSTTASLVSHLLDELDEPAELAGNIGVPLLDLFQRPPTSWWVLELSSYQTADVENSPDIGVLTSLSPEHLNWHGSYERYVADKLNLFAHRDDMVSLVNGTDPAVVQVAETLPNTVVYGTPEGIHASGGNLRAAQLTLFPSQSVALLGRHNLLNVCGAIAVLQAMGIDVVERRAAIRKAIESFDPLPYRLQPVARSAKDVLYVDDGLATAPAAAEAAMEAFAGKPVTLIAGGFDRGLPYDGLARYLAGRSPQPAVVLLPPSGKRIAEELVHCGATIEWVEVETVEEAVVEADERTPPGGVVLLSPAAPSFGAYRDYRERSEAFRRAAVALPDATELVGER